jgi:hypothetical protein
MHKARVRLEADENSIEIEIGIEIDSVRFYAGGTGNSLPVLRSNKRLLLKVLFVSMKGETLSVVADLAFVENLLAFGHRHQCRCHPVESNRRDTKLN